MKKAEKQFLKYCNMFKIELENLQKTIDEEDFFNNDFCCTLAYLGLNYSYELANIGFELGYSSWAFEKNDNFDKVKNNFLSMIMQNEKIVGCYTEKELKKIEKRILKCKENK